MDIDVDKLPKRWAICGDCRGEGHNAAHLGEVDYSDDPEGFEDYMAGRFDQVCPRCEGSGKVKVVDEARLSPDELAAFEASVIEDWRECAIAKAERAFGA